MDKLKIKPCKTIHLGMLIFWVIANIIVIEILGIILSNDIKEFLMGNFLLICSIAISFIIYICVRLFYRSVLVFTEDEIIKYKGKKIVLKVSKNDIVELGYRKMYPIMKFLLPFWFFFGDPMCGVISIRFKTAEFTNVRVFDSMLVLHTLTEEEKATGLMEYCECFTKKDMQKICKILNLTTKEVELL